MQNMNVTLPLLQPLAVKSRLFVIVATLAICIIIIEAVPTSAFGEPRGGTQQPNEKEEPPSVVHPVHDAVLPTTSTRDYTQSMRALRKRSKGRSMSMSLSMTMDPPPARVDGCTVRVRS